MAPGGYTFALLARSAKIPAGELSKRRLAISALRDKLSEIVAAAEAGGEIVITRHGRDVVKLVAIPEDRMDRQRTALDVLHTLGRKVQRDHGPTSRDERRAWINMGRRPL